MGGGTPDIACSDGMHTWANTEAIHFVKKYQNNHLACYKSVSDSRGSGRCPKACTGSEGAGAGAEGGQKAGCSACSLVEVGPVIWALDMDPPHALDPLPLSLLILVQVMRASSCPACGLQEGIVRSSAILGLVQQDIQGLLINAGFGELNLCPHKIHGRNVSRPSTHGHHLTPGSPAPRLTMQSQGVHSAPWMSSTFLHFGLQQTHGCKQSLSSVTSSSWQGWGGGI